MKKSKNPEYSCEKPLDNVRHERFAQLILEGYRQPDAYREAGFQTSDASVHAAASRLAARPEVKMRIKALQLDSIAGAGPITVAEIQRKLETIIRTSSNSGDVIKAMTELDAQTGILQGMKAERQMIPPDPCAIAEFLCGWAGMTGADIVKQMGGVAAMEKNLSEVLKVRVTLHV